MIDQEEYYSNIVHAVSCVCDKYHRMSEEYREQIEAETVIDMIDAALRVNEDTGLVD